MIRYLFLFIICFSVNSVFSQQDKDYFIRAKIAEDYQKLDSAIKLVSEAIKINPNSIYLETRAQLFYKNANYQAALADYLNIANDSNGLVNYRIACCYSIFDSLEKSAFWLKKYLSSTEKIPENLLKTDTIFNKLKKTTAWSSIWMNNWYSSYENYMGDLYYLSVNDKINEMYDVIDSALSHYPEKPELWLWRARVFTIGNNPKEAMKSLDMAVKYNPENVDALTMRANMLRNSGKSKRAILDYSSILKVQPWNLKYLKERGYTKVEAEDYSGAVTDLLAYFEYDTLDANILFQAAHATYLKGDFKDAINYYSSAIIKDGGMSQCFFERGRCYQELMDYENAFADFSMAIDLIPNKGEYFYYRALVYYSQKNKIGACHDWEKARSLDYLKAQEYMLRFCADQK